MSHTLTEVYQALDILAGRETRSGPVNVTLTVGHFDALPLLLNGRSLAHVTLPPDCPTSSAIITAAFVQLAHMWREHASLNAYIYRIEHPAGIGIARRPDPTPSPTVEAISRL